jgi:hypothetical protein
MRFRSERMEDYESKLRRRNSKAWRRERERQMGVE